LIRCEERHRIKVEMRGHEKRGGMRHEDRREALRFVDLR